MSQQGKLASQKVFDYILNYFELDSTRRVYDCIIEAIKSLSPGLDAQEIYTVADRIENSVKTLVDSQVEEYKERELPAKIYWDESDENKLIGRCFVYRGERRGVRTFKTKLLAINQIQRTLANLSWGDFEKVCRKLTSLQPRFCRVRRKRHDGGIDFHGTCEVSSTQRIPFGGQAKRYAMGRKIGPNLIRELDSSLRAHGYAFGIIMATCRFTEGARKSAIKKNIDALDGEQIAYRLIELDVCLTIVSGQANFSQTCFLEWLAH